MLFLLSARDLLYLERGVQLFPSFSAVMLFGCVWLFRCCTAYLEPIFSYIVLYCNLLQSCYSWWRSAYLISRFVSLLATLFFLMPAKCVVWYCCRSNSRMFSPISKTLWPLPFEVLILPLWNRPVFSCGALFLCERRHLHTVWNYGLIGLVCNLLPESTSI